MDRYDKEPLIDTLQSNAPGFKLRPLMPALISAKAQAAYNLAKGRYALRPMNNAVMKATEADRTIEMEGRTADLKQEYDELNDLYELCMVLVGKS